MENLVSLTTFQESHVAEQLPLGSALMKSIHIINGSSIGQHFPVFQEISPEYSLEELILKWKPQYVGHLI